MKITSALCSALAVIIFLTGCAGPAGGEAATSTPTPARTGSASPVATDPGESESTGAASDPATDSTEMPSSADPAECDGDDLDISIAAQPTASGAGSYYSEITFTNTGSDACFVEGPPSIFNLADSATGGVAGKRAPDSGLPEVAQLAPGASAYSSIHFSNAGAYDCDTAVADVAYVSPPNWDSSRTITLETPVTVCTTPATYLVSWISATSLFR